MRKASAQQMDVSKISVSRKTGGEEALQKHITSRTLSEAPAIIVSPGDWWRQRGDS